MSTSPYPVLGPSLPPMLGRATLIERIQRHLLKPSPDHVSVVGPKHYGKSVLLRHLVHAHRTGSGGFLTAVYIDLRHDTPLSDGEFKHSLARAIKTALEQVGSELAEWICLDDEKSFELLDVVLEELVARSPPVLVVLDGFDYVLAADSLTRSLWDQLRALAQRSSLRLVTGSRRPLSELCRSEQSRTSDFWEIFYDTPVRVAALETADWPAFLQPLQESGCEVDASAEKEIANWTGGVPTLACALLGTLWDKHHGQPISKEEVDAAAAVVLDGRRELLAALWNDCTLEMRGDLARMSDGADSLGGLSDPRRSVLVDRGFVRLVRNHVRGSCRLMQSYAKAQAPAIADLNRLFRTVTDFETHIRTLLELRLEQVATPAVDEELRRFVGNAVRDITPHSRDAFTWIRSVTDRALALIWDAELPRDKTLPKEWLDEWEQADARAASEGGKLPRSSGAQCGILRLVTGSYKTRRQSRYVTKSTYLLVDHLQSVGNIGAHPAEFQDLTVTVGFAASVVLGAISLMESLTAELEQAGVR